MSKSVVGILAVAGLASAAFAQAGSGGTIVDGDTRFTLSSYTGGGTGVGPTADFVVDAGQTDTDHMFQAWWWFRLAGDTRETTLSNATSWSWVGNVGRLTYTYPTFRATVQYVVTGIEPGLGFVTQTVTIFNTTNQPLTLDLFNYQDLDMAESASNDSATQAGANVISVTDGGNTGWRAEYEGTNAFQVASFDSLRDMLTDINVDNLNGTGLPFGPGDWTGGYQWSFTLSPFTAATASATVTIIPAPGALALLGLGGLIAGRRRR
jgi:MYXO-CTERM domain-containing protein